MATVRKRTWGDTKTAWVVDYCDSNGRRQRKHFPNKRAADAFRISVEGQVQAGTYRAAADKVTVRELVRASLHSAKRATPVMSA